ncbi:MAG: hypothetical protein IMZ62_07615 [Chloroflexi bacterium]|nr:hypothetical protein [Chloroflexota bacterium]
MAEKCPKCGLPMMNGKPVKPTHGTCCTCQACGHHYDDCICHEIDGEVCQAAQIAALTAAKEIAEEALRRVHLLYINEPGAGIIYNDDCLWDEHCVGNGVAPLLYALAEAERTGETE